MFLVFLALVKELNVHFKQQTVSLLVAVLSEVWRLLLWVGKLYVNAFYWSFVQVTFWDCKSLLAPYLTKTSDSSRCASFVNRVHFFFKSTKRLVYECNSSGLIWAQKTVWPDSVTAPPLLTRHKLEKYRFVIVIDSIWPRAFWLQLSLI